MQRKFLLNIIFIVILNLLIKPFWFFGIEVAVQNHVNNEAYGLYFSLLSFTMVFNFLLDLGITNFNNREIAMHNHLVSKYFSNIATLKLILGLCYFILCIVGGMAVGYKWGEFRLLAFLMINQFLASFILYLRSNINGLLLFITDSILSVLDKSLMILFIGTLLWTNFLHVNFTIEWFVYAQTLSYIITAIIASAIVISKCDYFIPRINIAYLKIMLKKSLPFSLLVLLMLLYNRIEPILLERLLPDGKVQAGIYAQGFRILEVLSNFAYLFPVLLLPLFSKMLKQKEDVGHLVALAVSLVIIPGIALSTTCSIYSHNIMNLLYHQPSTGGVFGIVILGFTGISITYLYGTLLTANGNLKQLNIMAVIAVSINVCLNLFLIPRYKAQGAAWSSFTTQTLTAFVQLLLAYKILKLKTDKIKIIRLFSWIALFAGSVVMILKFIKEWQYGFIAMIIFGIVFALLLKLLNLKEMVRILFLSDKKEIATKE
jgi:O-antigen/teichoic acid export membrane protein